MKTIVKWLNNPVVLTILLITGVVIDLVLLGRAYCLDKSEWAAWVQAVGSIVAIFLAFLIGERQATAALRSVREADRLVAVRRYDAVVALAQSAQTFGTNTGAIFRDGGFALMELDIKYQDAIMEDLIDALKAIPAHELGSHGAVLLLISLRKAMVDLRGNVLRAREKAMNQRNAETGAMPFWYEWSAVPIELCVTKINRCAERLGNERPEFLM